MMKLYIWGTGRLVGKVVDKYINNENVMGYIDNNKDKNEYLGKPVYSPEEILKMEYDAICVANLYSEEIYAQCQELDIDLNRVIFLYSNCRLTDFNKDYEFIRQMLGAEFADIIKNRYRIVRIPENEKRPYIDDIGLGLGYNENDYIRFKSFELAVEEIKKRKIAGAVAEVGVFRGEFAQYINYAFPDRKCYLFDTFEGFDVEEAFEEVKNGNCTNAFIEAYKQTDIEMVLARMKYVHNVIIKQGFFPESLNGLEDCFAFVSLDVDFEKSIYEGLKYFYPRLSVGGYIFIHDYNSDLLGVRKAIDNYEKDNGIILCKVPLCDANGTLVVTK